MTKTDEKQAWYNALPKKMQKLLDLWEENDLYWIGSAWDDEPESVELNCSTDAGEDMYIDLHKISADDLEEYVNDFDINEEVSLWWKNGQPGRGVPFENQGEQVADYEDYLAWLRDIIDLTRGVKKKKGDLSHQQELVVDNFMAAARELGSNYIHFTWSKKKGFTFKNSAESNKL